MRSEPVDVVVAGGGPAGLATAIGAREAGLTAVVIDRRRPPIDVACGEGLMPDGVARLNELGVRFDGDGGRPFRGIRYVDGSLVAEGRWEGDPGWGIRRTRLHRALVHRAAEVGVDLRWGCACRGPLEDGFDTDDGPIRGRWLVAADGRASAIRRQAGLDGRPGRRRRFGVRRHYRVAPWTDLVEVHWVDGVEAYVTPVTSELVGVALLWRDGVADFDRLLTRFPALAERLHGVEVASSDRGAGPLEQRARDVIRGRLALVGDASGYLDAISGEGLSLAFHQAEALVAAMVAGDLRSYAAAHRRIGRHPKRLTSLLLLLSDRPTLRRRVMARLAADPSLMSRFLSLKARPGGPRVFGREGLVHLALATVAGGRST